MEGVIFFFLVEKDSLGQVFLRGPQFSPVVVIPVMTSTNLFIDHQIIQSKQMTQQLNSILYFVEELKETIMVILRCSFVACNLYIIR